MKYIVQLFEWRETVIAVPIRAVSRGVSEPNREDDPEYIVRLVGQVIAVSLETVKVVIGLPAEYST